MTITIKEFANGMFQVWKTHIVVSTHGRGSLAKEVRFSILHPRTLTWERESSSQEGWMFVASLEEAVDIIKKLKEKNKVVCEYSDMGVKCFGEKVK